MLKRLWDTENKKMVRAVPTAEAQAEIGRIVPMQVWTNDDGSKLYVYDERLNRQEITSWENATASEYGPVWKSLEDEEVGYYLTNTPTDLYSWDSGDEAAYRFMNGTTVLQSGTVDEGQTPEYTGETPTKDGDAQYAYTFSGWKPTVGPIYKKTDFKAQFTRELQKYTVSIESNDTDYGTVNESSVADVPYGTKLTVAGNVLTIGEGASAVTVTATPETGYVVKGWSDDNGDPLPGIVEGDISIVASFGGFTVNINTDRDMGSVSETQLENVAEGTAVSTNDNVLSIGETDITATPSDEGVVFSRWEAFRSSDVIAQRGPCPEGFHIPDNGELGAFGSYYVQYVYQSFSEDYNKHLTTAGELASGAYFWSCEGKNALAEWLPIQRDYIEGVSSSVGAYIRPFRNETIIPYDRQGDNELLPGWEDYDFYCYNPELGLISFQDGDGLWHTIMDKNLGETENSGGNFYQRGNNYGFPHSGPTTTSASAVDASAYGPGNYYSSSTWITADEPYNGWDSSENGNLWGHPTSFPTEVDGDLNFNAVFDWADDDEEEE